MPGWAGGGLEEGKECWQSPKIPVHRAQTKFAVAANRFVRRGYSILQRTGFLACHVHNNCIAGRISPNLAPAVCEMSEPSTAWGVKRPFSKYRLDLAGWLPILISFHTRAECAFLTPLPPKNKNEEQMRDCPALPPSDFTWGEVPVKHRNGAVETELGI